MKASEQHCFFHDTVDGRILFRGAYSAKPLYFFSQPIITATGNKWLVSHSLREIGSYVNYRPSPEGVRDFLCYGFVPAPRTIFQDIVAVPPNTQCRLPHHGHTIDWQTLSAPVLPVVDQAEQDFWQHLCQHISTKSASILLSGGLDSAMVAAAATASGTKLDAYHARFSGIEVNETSDSYASRLTAQHLGLNYREITINSFHALRWFGEAVRVLDQPLGDPVILPFYLLCKEIQRQQRQQPVFTGEGGDQLFGSWSMKPMLAREFYPEANYCRAQAYLASFHKFVDEWNQLISPQLNQQLDPRIILQGPIQQAFASSPSTNFCNQLRWVDLQLKGLQHIVPRIEAMAGAYQLQLQHPFFQSDMIELAIALPNHLKLSATTDKVLLKMLAKHYLPEQIIDRRKQGMGVPTSQWFQRGLRPLAMYWLNKKRLQQSGLLNPDTVQAIRQQELTTRDARGRRWGDRLWMLCVLECWFASLQ